MKRKLKRAISKVNAYTVSREFITDSFAALGTLAVVTPWVGSPSWWGTLTVVAVVYMLYEYIRERNGKGPVPA